MRIQHNIAAMNSYRNYVGNSNSLAKNLEKLSSGYRINRAGDDAAGLAISEKMRAQISGLDQAQANVKDGISLVKTAEGALQEVQDMMNRMVTLATQSANGTYQNDVDRENLQAEVDALKSEIDRIAKSSNFNGQKLLDGSLGAQNSDALTFTAADGVNFGDGMTAASVDGAGAKSQFKLTLDKAFSEGDTVTLNFNIPDGSGGSTSKSITLTHTSDTPDGTGLQFTGKTIEQQLDSIAAKLKAGSDATLTGVAGGTDLASLFNDSNGKYKISKEGNSLVFTAATEGAANQLHIADVSVSNKDAGVTYATTAGDANATGTIAKNGVTKLLTGDKHYKAGDVLRFEFNVNDVATYADVEITDDMVKSNDTNAITEAIVAKLKDTSFADSKTSAGFDESQFKVGDLFDVKANTQVADGATAEDGSISIQVKNAGMGTTATAFKLTDVKISNQGSAFASAHDAAGATQVVAGDNTVTPGTNAGKTEITLSDNMAIGDKFVLEGTLSDGRSFKVELTAGDSAQASQNVFAIGTGATAKNTTASNIAALLNGDCKVQVTDAQGNTVDMKGSDVFGTGKTFAAATAAGGKITVANAAKGANGLKGITGSITFSDVEVAGAASMTATQVTAGADQTKGSSEITFAKDLLEYGSAITVGEGANAKTFELVASEDAAVTEKGNIKVVIEDLAKKSSADIAKAFADKINGELKDGSGNYTQWAQDLGIGTKGSTSVAANMVVHTSGSDKISLTTATAGSTIKAIKMEATYGTNKNVTLNYNKDEEGNLKLKAGDTIKINGKTYQFDTDIRKVASGNNFIKVEDFTDTEEIAKAIKLAVETDDSSLSVSINGDNSVTISGKLVNGKYVEPKLEQTQVGGGMTLQIGDTADEYNQLNVSIDDMHTSALGIADVNIGDIKGAQAAIETIKNAINTVSSTRGNLGAIQNRLEHTSNNLSVMTENIQDAESTIRDTDIADEMTTYTKNNILLQSAQAMLAQANQMPQGVLQLLQ